MGFQRLVNGDETHIGGGRPHLYVIHENAEWLKPLRAALDAKGVAFTEWFVDGCSVDLSGTPPEGVFYNRMSASSHTRGHRYAPEMTASILAWLESHGRPVFNGWRAVQLEISKAAQYAALQAEGVAVPRTVLASGAGDVLAAAARHFTDQPFVLKPNRGGKGLGVRKFEDIGSLQQYLESPEYSEPIDGLHLLQEYIAAPEPYIVRMEFIGGKLFYAVRVDTRSGFELCPAEVCTVDPRGNSEDLGFCPTEGAGTEEAPQFQIIEGFDHPLVPKLERFMARNKIDIAGIEFITSATGAAYVYDVNTNTNYNPVAEKRAGISAMARMTEVFEKVLSERMEQDRAAD